MTREIKFRCWDKVTNKMVGIGFHVIGEVTIFGCIDVYAHENPMPKEGYTSGLQYDLDRWNEFELMQWTGLQDKNGADIYEGDIGEIMRAEGDMVRFVVEYGIHRRTMDTAWTVDIPGFSFVRLHDGFRSFPIVKNWADKHDLEMIEIIGKIYENPDLIV